MNLGGIYKELGQLDQALIAVNKSMELDAHNVNCYSLILSVFNCEKTSRSKEVLREGLRICSKDIYLQNNLSCTKPVNTSLAHCNDE